MGKLFNLDLKLLFLVITVCPAFLFSLLDQFGWAAVVTCQVGVPICNGTDSDDIIFGISDDTVIHGLGGNDYIIGYSDGDNVIWGDDGDDILIGGYHHDALLGGLGSDRYDGLADDDTITEEYHSLGSLINNDDIISGGEGSDFIWSGEGFDRIDGGMGADSISPNPYYRDFSTDIVNCGADNDQVTNFYSGDGETATNCEFVGDNDR